VYTEFTKFFSVSDIPQIIRGRNSAFRIQHNILTQPKMPLSVTVEIVEACKDIFASSMSNFGSHTIAVLQQNNVNFNI